MFERYNEKARRTIFFARYEARQWGAAAIETEHMLLGILHENADLIAGCGVKSIRLQIEQTNPPATPKSKSADLPLSSESKRVLAYAAQEADLLGYGYIGPEHLLAGLLREAHSFAAEILAERKVSLATVRKTLDSRPAEGRGWPVGEIPFSIKAARWRRAIRLFLLAILVLFFVQVVIKSFAHELVRDDAIFYAIGFPIVLTGFLLLTWFLRLRRRIARRQAVRDSVITIVPTLLALVLILRAIIN